jgi:IS30 family transposase
MRCGAKYKFIQDSKWLEYIEKCVKLGESPGSAIGRIETEGLQFGVDITERTFYNYVERGISNITPFDLRFKLRRRAPKHKKIRENKRKLGKSIEERPENINSRAEFGHWEGDSVVDKNDNAILVLVERKSRKCVLYKLPKHDSNTVLEKMKIFLKEYKPKSLTMDNGSEFHRVPQLENEDFICYFTHPYSSFEKGSVENLNGIIRRYIPKGSDISKLTEEDVKRVEMQVNDMPRKIHGYYTSEEMYQSLTKNEPPTILKKHLDNVIFLTQKMCI